MTDSERFVAHHSERLRAGEDAFFPLIEAEDAVVPILIEACRAEHDPDVRAALVEIIWQHRIPETIEFLSQALTDDVPEVWENALDGLVALGGKAAIEALKSARDRISVHGRATADKVEWIDEAVCQIREGLI